ncbi:MAG: response regulator [Anaerolineales bacterium]
MVLSKVLLADDHTVVRAGLRNALGGMPEIEIIGEVGNGKELMDALANSHVDLLVMDANMPDFEPISATKEIKVNYPALKILIVSAYADETYVVGLLKAGVDGYHLKDQPLADLRLAVNRILIGERWITSSLLSRLTNAEPPRPHPTAVTSLTRRQRELLRLLAQGADNRTIAAELEISVKTVENHLTALYRTLGVDSRLKAVNYTIHHPEVLASNGQEMVDMESETRGADSLVILVVDDNPRYRHQLCHLIGKITPTSVIYEADNTAEALRIAEKAQPHLGLIDVVLEDEDGIKCASRLKTISPSTRMVLISAYPDREFHRRALSAGAVAFLDKKDLDTASLRQVVEDALR